MTRCRNCGYERKPQDDELFSHSECPRCRIIYGKLSPRSEGQDRTAQSELKSITPHQETSHGIFPTRLPIKKLGKHLLTYYLIFKSKPFWQRFTLSKPLLLIMVTLLILTTGTFLIYSHKKGEDIKNREIRERELLKEIAAREQEVRHQEEVHRETIRQMEESHEEDISREADRLASLKKDLERQEEAYQEDMRRQEELRKEEVKRLDEARKEEVRRQQGASNEEIRRENERLAYQYEMQRKWGHLLKIQQILSNYRKTHTYSLPDYFVCSDMAMDVWNQLKTEGINAKLRVGIVDKNIYTKDGFDYLKKMNHAWVVAEILPSKWIALETTGGFVVSKDYGVPGAQRNDLYFSGYEFSNPKEFKAFNESRTQVFEICNEAENLQSRWNAMYAGKRRTYESVMLGGVVAAKSQECVQAQVRLIDLLKYGGNTPKN